jgi:hypothetical protein
MAKKGPAGQQRTRRRPMHPRAREQRLEMGVGILGFFTAALLINTVVMEIRGEDALLSAFFLLLCAIGLAVLLHKRWEIFTRR